MVSTYFWLPFLSPEGVEKRFIDYFIADKHENSTITEFCDYLVDHTNIIHIIHTNNSIFPPEMQQYSDKSM